MNIFIVGVGMGDTKYLTKIAEEKIKNADIIIGAKRVAEPYVNEKKVFFEYETDKIKKILEENKCENAVILFSGDTSFFSGAKKLKEEFVRVNKKNWTNITISIQNYRFMVEYDYEDLKTCEFNSYERHIIWRYIHLKTGLNTYNKKERKIINSYLEKCKYNGKVIDRYIEGIYRNRIHNVINYNKEDKKVDELKYIESNKKNEKQKIEGKKTVNQILRY